MTSQPEEPAARDIPERARLTPSPAPERDPLEWKVPHLTQAPSAPRHSVPGSFTADAPGSSAREAHEASGVSPPSRPRRLIDLPTVATLAAGLPWAIGSFMVVAIVLGLANVLLPIDALVFPLMALWMMSGVIVFLPAAESFVAHNVLRLRWPTDSEGRVLDGAWREVACSAGIAPEVYSVWIEDREDVNSCLPGGRFLAVPRTISRIPMRQQAAVLAHELGHHLGGYAWARLLVHWYSAPARGVVRAYRAGLRAGSGPLGCLSGLVLLLLGAVAVFAIITTPEARPAILALPFLPWLSRWAEKRCDRVAADLGFGPDLLELFQWWQDSGLDQPQAGGVVRQLFSSHPTVASRIHALRAYMTENGTS